MPIDMQRAPRIPVGRPSAKFDRIEIEAVEGDGSYIVTVYEKPGGVTAKGPNAEMAVLGMSAGKKYTFQDANTLTGFVSDKLNGRSNPAKGEPLAEAAPPEGGGPPEAEEPSAEEMIPDNEEAEA